MPFDRRFYGWEELYKSAAAMTMIAALTKATRRSLQRHASLSAGDLATILQEMNASDIDLGHKFIYADYLGGLAHVQWSYLANEDFFLLAPKCRAFPSKKPIDRVSLQSNGVMCTLAPADISAMYLRALNDNSVRVHVRETHPILAMSEPSVCAQCLTPGVNLLHCTCGTVRYCNRKCQRAHWSVGHKALCRWCISCMESFGPTDE